MSKQAWIISAGAYVAVDLAALGIKAAPRRVMVYQLSDIGRYLLSPGSFEVRSRLLGCECHLKPSGWRRFRMALARYRPLKRKDQDSHRADARQVFLAHLFVPIPSLRDESLARHVDRLRAMLKPFDPVMAEIAGLNLDRLSDIRGVCEDAGGHRTHITLSGDLATKQRYVLDNLLQRVPITLPQARIADGLYEMRGLAAKDYRAERQHRLLRFHVNGQFFACLLNQAGRVAFWIEDARRLHDMLLFQQAMETNPSLKDSVESCLRGENQALRLLVNHEMDIDYSRNRLPRVYQDLIQDLKLNDPAAMDVIDALNALQTGVSFSFACQEGYGDPRSTTSISIMHDLKALEPVREVVPDLYAAINRQATVSEAGKFYLLESIKGHPDEERL